MKVFYKGFNLYHQFPHEGELVEEFIDCVYDNALGIEVSYHYVVLLVANTIVIEGAKNKKFPIGERILQFACNEDRILAVLSNGDLIKITDSVTKLPKLPNFDDGDCVKLISSGAKLAIALSTKGKLYNIPNKLDYENCNIVDIKTGREHCLLLDANGNVFSFGRGSRGQLGHGCLDEEQEPRFIEALGGISISTISAGGWHSCALSKDGDLYVWGWNGNGQLGLSDVSVMATPRVLDFECNIKKISCGSRHTVVLTDQGILYGCGWNKYKQLKDALKEDFFEMTYLEDFSKEKIEEIKCGPWNTLVVVEDE